MPERLAFCVAMLQRADSVTQALPVGRNGFAARVQGYTVVPTMTGKTVCTRGIHDFSTSDGKPHVQGSICGKAASTVN